ncbi:hypothetical protein [Streptomyces goshikiensis]|uniref:hypothetical protein n=1 Tax=Streptomyces goshikiensis TaxID=1942 RepID=UPI0036545A10
MVLHALAGTPFGRDARSALHKVLAVMPQHERHGADELGYRVRLAAPARQPAAVPQALAETVPPRALDLAELDRLGWEFIGLDELVNTDRGLPPEA